MPITPACDFIVAIVLVKLVWMEGKIKMVVIHMYAVESTVFKYAHFLVFWVSYNYIVGLDGSH